MPQESTFDVRIAHSSPLFTASPLTGNRTTGWSTLCTASGYPCDGIDQSAVYTTLAGATMSLEFWGSRIEVRGNITGGMSLAWDLDGRSRSPDANGAVTESANAVGEPLGSGLLGVFSGLDSNTMHKLQITTKRDLPSAVVAFEGVVVTVGTGVAGGTTTQQYLDDTDSRLQYTQTPGGWAQYNEYESPAFNITLPPGVTGKQFHCSKEPGESVSLNFQGTQILLYGPCYASNGAYTITLDNQSPVVYNASLNAYSAPLVASVAQACLRYISPPLNPDELHYVSMANADSGRETNLDWALVIENSGGGYLNGGTKPKPNVAVIAGAVAGVVALLLALVALWLVIRRRRRKAKRVVAHEASDKSSNDRKLAHLDLLSTVDAPSLLSNEHKPNVLISPSHGSSGSQSNMTSFRRIEPFELPPLVVGARNTGGKAGSAGEPSPQSASPRGTQAHQEAAVASGRVPAAESTDVSASGVPFREEPREQRAVPPPAPVSFPQVPPAPAQPTPVPLAPSSDVSQPSSGPAASSHARATSQPDSQVSTVPDLSQISSDVNRILVQLGQIRRRADSNVNGAEAGMSEVDEDDVPVEAPPQYGKHRRV